MPSEIDWGPPLFTIPSGPLSFDDINLRRLFLARTLRPLVEIRVDELDSPPPAGQSVTITRRGLLADTTFTTCPYKDSRAAYRGRLMNLDALLEINRNNAALFDGFAWLREHYFNGEPPSSVTAEQMHEMAVIAIMLPVYLVFRAQKPVDPWDIPVSVAVMAKASEGIRRAGVSLIQEGQGATPFTGALLYEYSNKEDMLNGHSLLVGETTNCPAAPPTIIEDSDVLISGTEGDASRSDLSRYLPANEFERLREFAGITEQYRILLTTARAETKRMRQLRDTYESTGDRDKVAETIYESIRYKETADLERDALQYEFNRLLGRL